MGKKYDIVAAVGKYEINGQEKTRWQTVGAVIEGQKGPYIVIEPWFNPAGLEQHNGNTYLKLFEPKPKGSFGGGGGSNQNPSAQPPVQKPQLENFDDNIPF